MLFLVEGARIEPQVVAKQRKSNVWQPSGSCFANRKCKQLNDWCVKSN